MTKICLLPRWQAEDFREGGNKLDCRKHRHLKVGEALQLMQLGNVRWVNPRAVEFIAEREWRVIRRWKFPQLNLVEK